MKILRNMTVLLLLCVLLVGCRPSGRNLPDYRARDFRAEVRLEFGEVDVYAEVLAEREENAAYATLRHVRLLAPPSISGIELTLEGETVILARDGIRTPAAGATVWWDACTLLCAEGTLRSVCDTEWEGLSLDYAEIRSGARMVELYREPETGIPKRIVDGETELTVIRFEGVQART